MNSKKRYILIVIFISLIVRIAVSQDTNKDKFYQGVTYFTAGSYKEALKIWTDIYNTGYK
jgi:ABC-type molybdate transport system substrate-binding protein